ncbi:MAG TPA: hypothetical protein VFO59_00590 [Dehalococcoidia bacterium]|nr:hypothetical protein [Dehalococcoidia bacterium]
MLHQDYYVREKLRDLERAQVTVLSRRPDSAPRDAPVIGPVVRRTGRLLHRLGAGLESWGCREPEPMHLGSNPH